MFLIPSDYYEVKKIKNIGQGIFAKVEIPGGLVIGDYLGKLIRADQETEYEKKYGHYLMFYNDQASIFPVDIKSVGTHLINHSCSPNCATYPYRGHMIFFALRRIFLGEEISISYDISPPKLDDRFHYPCFCQSPVCRGTFHDSKENLERWLSFARKRLGRYRISTEVKFGYIIPPLPKYPQSIKDNKIFDIYGNFKKRPWELQDTSLPPISIMRRFIRESGRSLKFNELKIIIFGIKRNMVIGEIFSHQKLKT